MHLIFLLLSIVFFLIAIDIFSHYSINLLCYLFSLIAMYGLFLFYNFIEDKIHYLPKALFNES